MRKARIFQSTIFRLAAVYVLLFAATVAALGVATYLATSIMLNHHLNARIESTMATLQSSYRSGGLPRLMADVNARQRIHRSSSLYYLVLGPHGTQLAGHLPSVPTRAGWSDMNYVENESDRDMGQLRVLLVPVAGSVRLAVAADLEQLEGTQEVIFDGFLSAFGAVVLLGTVGGIALSLALLKRVETIRRTAEAIIAGDLSQRVPLKGSADDLDRLSQTLNHMLDRIAELMESLRQVSADVAHDLKTPLARLRQRLETLQRHAQSAEDYNAAVEAAIGHVDEILATFGALLRIAQIEAGTRRAGFRDVDLSGIFTAVIDAFAPAAEDAGQTLTGQITAEIHVFGDRELLTQMIANLVENAIRHTPAGTRGAVSLYREGDYIIGKIADNGPGVPDEERERLFQRLYRLERSRSTPGSGLGLSLVKAVADLHAIALEVRNAGPGLEVLMRFRP
ncbi:MAG: sensor histidine kinase [Methylovirgula sp.]